MANLATSAVKRFSFKANPASDDDWTPIAVPYSIDNRGRLQKIWERVRQAFDREYSNDPQTKFAVYFEQFRQRTRVTLVRIDNRDEDDGFYYKPVDRLWAETPGWPSGIKLCLAGYCVDVPGNAKDCMSLELPPIDAPNASTEHGYTRIVYQWAHGVDAPCMQKALQSFSSRRNPSWEHRIAASEAEAREMLITAKADPVVLVAFDSLHAAAFKSDLWRYAMLWATGGVYADGKLVLLQPLDDILASGSSLLLVRDIYGAGVLNAFMAVKEPRHPLLRAAIDGVVEKVQARFYGTHILGVTGPRHLGDTLEAFIKQQHPKIEWLQFQKAGLAIERRGEPVVLFHNAEYRRLFSRPDLPGHYERIWRERRLYGENVIATLSPGKSCFWTQAALLAILMVAAIVAFKRMRSK